MLSDDDFRVPLRVAEGLFGKRAGQTPGGRRHRRRSAPEEPKIEITDAALLKFISNRTLSEADQKQYRALVKDMGVISTWCATGRRRIAQRRHQGSAIS